MAKHKFYYHQHVLRCLRQEKQTWGICDNISEVFLNVLWYSAFC